MSQMIVAPLAGQVIGLNKSAFVMAEWADPGAPAGPPRPLLLFMFITLMMRHGTFWRGRWHSNSAISALRLLLGQRCSRRVACHIHTGTPILLQHATSSS